jgi:hypothetical protein
MAGMTHMDAYVRAMMAIGNISDHLRTMVEAATYDALLHSKRVPGEPIGATLDHYHRGVEEHFLDADVNIAMLLDHLLNTINPMNDPAKKRFAEDLLAIDEETAKQELRGQLSAPQHSAGWVHVPSER